MFDQLNPELESMHCLSQLCACNYGILFCINSLFLVVQLTLDTTSTDITRFRYNEGNISGPKLSTCKPMVHYAAYNEHGYNEISL